MGYKTGQSRCLIEAADREWDMELPVPVPLTTLAPILQLRNISAGFRTNITNITNNNTNTNNIEGGTESTSSPTKQSINDNNNNNNNNISNTTSTTTTTTKKLKVLGSNKNNKKNSSDSNSNNSSTNSSTNIPSDVTKILDSITFDLEQNTKIAIVGKNGCGKSTLLKLITQYGENLGVTPDSVYVISGEIFKHPNMKIAYYQQHQADCLPYELTPLQHLTNVACSLSGSGVDGNESGNRYNEQTLRAHLGAFGLGGDLALQQIGVLSGGQKSRVVFAELTLQR